MLKMASRINGCNKIVFNKMDVLEKVNQWCLYEGPSVYEFKNREDIETWLSSKLEVEVNKYIDVKFSGDKEYI